MPDEPIAARPLSDPPPAMRTYWRNKCGPHLGYLADQLARLQWCGTTMATAADPREAAALHLRLLDDVAEDARARVESFAGIAQARAALRHELPPALRAQENGATGNAETVETAEGVL